MRFIRMMAAQPIVDLINSTGYYHPLEIGHLKGVDIYVLSDDQAGLKDWPLAACVAIVRQGSQAYLDYLSVGAEYQQIGLASMLLESTKKKLAKQGVKIIHACVSGENGAAMKLAAKHEAKIGFPYMMVEVQTGG